MKRGMQRGFVLMVLVALAAVNSCRRRAESLDPDVWIESQRFAQDSPGERCAGRTGEWRVLLDAGRIDVAPRVVPADERIPIRLPSDPAFKGVPHLLTVDDGYLIGFDSGEWGGRLWWFSRDVLQRYPVAHGPVRQLLDHENHVVAATGVAHIIGDTGELQEVSRVQGQWRVVRSFDLHSEPQVVAPDSSGGLLIVTNKGLSRYSNGEWREVWHSDYASYGPNSAVEGSDGTVFIGMRHFVVGIATTRFGHEEKWFARKDCTSVTMDDPANPATCRCSSSASQER